MINYYKPPNAAQYHSMDLMLQTFDIDLQNGTIFHIGAHTGFDAYIYHGLGAKNIVWAECNPNLKEKAEKNISEYVERGYDDKWFNYAIWDEDDLELDFFFYNNLEDGTSSLLKPNGIVEKINGVKFLNQSTKVPTIKLDTLIEREQIDYQNTKLLNVDVQGSELHVFRGAQKLLHLPNLRYIICEISFESLYDGGALAHDVDLYLEQYGFQRIFFRPDCIPTHGDGIYLRTKTC